MHDVGEIFYFFSMCTARQGVLICILQITVDSIHDPKVGVIFHPESLIQALGDMLSWEDAL